MSLPKHRISVALCTYNGERFLAEQLDSIAQQTRLPDELVVCDDRSTDRTIALLHEFAATASFPVRIFENSQNLGVSANFQQAIRLCEADLIALCDQDDLWYAGRLARCEGELSSDAGAGLVFSDADLMNEQGQSAEQTLWQRLGFTGKPKRALLDRQYGVLAKHRFVTGATVMFRSALRDRCLPIPEGWIHDEWIAMVLAAFANLRAIDQPLIRYRIHSSQQVGLVNKLERRSQGATAADKHWDRIANSAAELEQLCDALSAMSGTRPEVLSAYRQHMAFLNFRHHLPHNRLARLGAILTRSHKYEVHASGLASMLKDTMLSRT